MAYKRIAVVRKYYRSISHIQSDIRKAGLTPTQNNPDIVLAVGGDGTFLTSERLYPGVPKILIKESLTCHKCEDAHIGTILHRLKSGDFRKEVHHKIEAKISGHKRLLIAVNDIVLRNRLVTRAIRFQVEVDSKPVNGEVIGDGIVASTPFGSEAYFYSIAKKTFTKGIGLAFNNPTTKIKPRVLPESSTIKAHVIRSAGILSADNNPAMVTVHEGETVTIRQSKSKVRIFRFLF